MDESIFSPYNTLFSDYSKTYIKCHFKTKHTKFYLQNQDYVFHSDWDNEEKQ